MRLSELQKPYFTKAIARNGLLFVLLAWGTTASIQLMRTKSEVLLVAIDDSGARLVTEQSDELLRKEKLNFLKKFISQLYSYTSEQYERNVTLAGNLMSDPLWKEKQGELKQIADRIKAAHELAQAVTINDIQSKDDDSFDAYLAITVRQGLQTTLAHLKVSIRTAKRRRTADNPWNYEVVSYAETPLAN